METAAAIIDSYQVATAQEVKQDMYDRFIAYLDATPKTVATYAQALRRLFTYFADNGIRQPKRENLISYREELKAAGRKPSTISLYIVAARLFFQWAAQEGLYPNIAEHLKGIKMDRGHKRDYLTSRQVKAVLNETDQDTIQGKRDYAILTLMVACGLRTIEVSRANIEDLRTVGDEAVIYVQGKGHEERTDFVKMPMEVEKAIRSYLKARGTKDKTEPLFTSLSHKSEGQRISTRAIRDIVKTKMRAAGYDSDRLSAHSLRHTAVTLSLLAGKPITEVSRFARHTNIATTMIYNHALDMANNTCSAAIAKAIF